jgi:hypothetical protein
MYSKNGSIPKHETDGTDGWIEVADAPEAPEDKEIVWWYPPGWLFVILNLLAIGHGVNRKSNGLSTRCKRYLRLKYLS